MVFRQALRRGFITFLRRGSWCALAAVLAPAFAIAQSVISPPMAQVFTGGKVYAIARQTDGKVIIGGEFTYVNGVPRSNIARINSNGSLDLVWNPGADSSVYALAFDGAGNVIVAGGFLNIGGTSRTGIGKLSLSGSGAADATWNPNANGGVDAMTLDPLGANIYVGGNFTTIGGQARAYLARLSLGGTGAADATWNPNPDSGGGFADVFVIGVSAIAADTAGNVFVAGNFSHIGGQSLSALAKLSRNGTGAADPTWDPHPTRASVAGTKPWYIGPLVLDTISNALYVAGCYDQIGGQIRGSLAKLSPTGSGLVDPAGNVYTSGLFGSIRGLPHPWMAKLSGNGTGAADPA